MIIDFTNKQPLNESWLSMLGSWSKSLLKHMYGDGVQVMANVTQPTITSLVKEEDVELSSNFILRGKYSDVKSYAEAIVREKEYLDAIMEFGKEHPQTTKAKERLDTAVYRFESVTGLRWPFKDEE